MRKSPDLDPIVRASTHPARTSAHVTTTLEIEPGDREPAMRRHVVIVGAGFAGLELATRLSDTLGDAILVTLVDRNDSFYFGFSKLDVLLGRHAADDVLLHYRDIAEEGVEFRQETVWGIDPVRRRVITDQRTYDADFLAVALGADYDMAATPGFREGGFEYYTLAGGRTLRETRSRFTGRDGRGAGC